MQLSIKVVVATLLVVVSICALVLACAPTIFHVHNDTMAFVLDAAVGAADQAQYVIEGKLQRIRKFGNVLHKAAAEFDLIAGLQPWPLVLWAGSTVIQEDISVLVFRPDNYGFLLTAYGTVTPGGTPWPGHVFLVNFSNPGVALSTGFWGLYPPHLPNNTVAPWSTSNNTLRYTTQPVGILLAQPNRSLSSMSWVGVSVVRPTTTAAFSYLTYGGPINARGNPMNRQYFSLSMRGTAFSNYMMNMSVAQNGGSLILFEVPTQSLVAGSINDSSAVFVNGTTTAQLNKLCNLRDPKVASVFHASYHDEEHGNIEGLDAVLTCALPCTFIYWPHDNTLRAPVQSNFNIDVLVHSFVVVRVLQVSGDEDGTPISPTMNLRLMVTAPSNIVVGGYVSAIRYSMLISLVTIFGLCIALVLASSFILQTLASMESEIFHLARSFLFQSMWETQTTRLHDEVERPRCCATAFSEFRRIFGAIRRLSRALYTLRAFSPSEMTPATIGGMGNSTSGDANSRCYSASQSSFMSPLMGLVEVVPYHILGSGSSGLWRVPVTTIFVVLDPFMLNPQTQEAMTIYNSHRAILEVFQKHVAKFAGASLDQFYGNRFLIHFNASGRTPKHALAALSVALRSLREVPDAVSFGISSSVSMCGYMGPPSCKVFTVVSNNVTHAGIMTRLAPEFKILGKLRVLLTWRATEVVKLEQRALIRKAAALLPNSQSVTRASSSRSFAALSMFDETAVTCEFKPIVEILLPREEANVPPYAYGVVPVADQARNVVSQ